MAGRPGWGRVEMVGEAAARVPLLEEQGGENRGDDEGNDLEEGEGRGDVGEDGCSHGDVVQGGRTPAVGAPTGGSPGGKGGMGGGRGTTGMGGWASASEGEEECRICKDEEGLIRPCACTGSMASVHPHCLQQWIVQRIHSGESVAEAHVCEVCHAAYQVSARHTLNPTWASSCGPHAWSLYVEAAVIILLTVAASASLFTHARDAEDTVAFRGMLINWLFVVGVVYYMSARWLQRLYWRWLQDNVSVVLVGRPLIAAQLAVNESRARTGDGRVVLSRGAPPVPPRTTSPRRWTPVQPLRTLAAGGGIFASAGRGGSPSAGVHDDSELHSAVSSDTDFDDHSEILSDDESADDAV